MGVANFAPAGTLMRATDGIAWEIIGVGMLDEPTDAAGGGAMGIGGGASLTLAIGPLIIGPTGTFEAST